MKKIISLLLVAAMVSGLVPILSNTAFASESWWFPLTSYSYIGDSFGCTCSIHKGNHSGQDIPAPSSSAIRSSKSGTVVAVFKGCSGSHFKTGCTCGSSYGNYVKVKHSDGWYSLYAHMSSVSVSNGQSVCQGQELGYVGTTGDSTGNHLHFEIRNSSNVCVNPMNYVSTNDKAPTIASLSMDKYEVRAGNAFTFTCHSDVLCNYYISIYRENGEKVYEGNINNTFTTSFLSCDHYSAHISAFNSLGSIDSNWVDFYVYGDPPSTATLSVNKNSVIIGDQITFTNTSNTYYSRYYMSIFCYDESHPNGYKYDDGWKSSSYTIKPKKAGKYSAHSSAYTIDGSVDSNWVNFTVYEHSYTISFNTNEGTNIPCAQTKNYGTNIILTSSEPTRTGYKFLGWATISDAKIPEYQPGDIYSKNEDLTLFAVWQCTHNYTSKITTPGTCTANGIKTFTCSRCNDTYTEVIPKTGHNYNAIVTPPTCTTKGYTTLTCSCGDTYKSNETAILGHSYTSAVAKEATCTADGIKTFTCSRCNDTYTEVIPKTGHNYNAIVTPPTCTTKGYTTFTCSCGDTYKSNETAILGHSYTSVVTKAPTCTADGIKVFTCSRCDNTYTEVIQKTGHTYSDWSIDTPPTSEKTGIERRICSLCGNVEFREIPKDIQDIPNYLLGDLNGDKKVNASDARIALRIAARLESADDAICLAADVDKDKKITAADARIILRVAAKLQTL